jgi:CheY-like chemotaxis protein
MAYASTQEQLVLITKSYYMKKIDSMGIDIFKVLYEPLNSTKLRTTLDAYDAEAFSNRKQKVTRRKKFDEKNCKFAASALVAEDNVINQKLIRRTLEDLGLEITLASNGLEAFEKRKNGTFDIIFMDIQMPVLDGIEATQEILDFEEDYSQHHIPIIALTANALKGDRERFLAAGMDEYTTKPLVRAEIISLLNNFLAHKIIDIKNVPKSINDISQSSDEELSIDTSNVENEPKIDVVVPQIEEVVESSVSENAFEDSFEETEKSTETTPLSEVKTSSEQVFDDTSIQEEEVQIDQIDNDIVPETNVRIPEVHHSAYDADILIAKQNTLEMKLFVRILEDLGYTYKSVNTVDQLMTELKDRRYKLALFDKTLRELNLKDVYDIIRANDSDTSLVMLIDPNASEDVEDTMYVHEIIKNIVNKDLLRLVFEKFI